MLEVSKTFSQYGQKRKEESLMEAVEFTGVDDYSLKTVVIIYS